MKMKTDVDKFAAGNVWIRVHHYYFFYWFDDNVGLNFSTWHIQMPFEKLDKKIFKWHLNNFNKSIYKK